jgi:hypothetical protein
MQCRLLWFCGMIRNNTFVPVPATQWLKPLDSLNKGYLLHSNEMVVARKLKHGYRFGPSAPPSSNFHGGEWRLKIKLITNKQWFCHSFPHNKVSIKLKRTEFRELLSYWTGRCLEGAHSIPFLTRLPSDCSSVSFVISLIILVFHWVLWASPAS